MSRLTNKRLAQASEGDYFIERKKEEIIKNPDVKEIYRKLAKYENLEEELGCPLEVVVKALRDGVYCLNSDGTTRWILRGMVIHTKDSIGFGFLDEREIYTDEPELFLWKDYKKTWFLREDRSEWI